MEKTETMKKYERLIGMNVNWDANPAGYQKWLESEVLLLKEHSENLEFLLNIQNKEISTMKAKASAYDRLMSGKPTLKELANVLQMAITVNPEPESIVKGFRHTPKPVWFENGEDSFGGWLAQEKYIFVAFESTTLFPPGLICFTGDWKDSLTLPDGWEEKCSHSI